MLLLRSTSQWLALERQLARRRDWVDDLESCVDGYVGEVEICLSPLRVWSSVSFFFLCSVRRRCPRRRVGNGIARLLCSRAGGGSVR